MVSKMGTIRRSTGIIQLMESGTVDRRSFNPNVATMNPRNMAPPSPMKILAGLKFQSRNPNVPPSRAAPSVATKTCPSRIAKMVKNSEAIAVTPVASPSM